MAQAAKSCQAPATFVIRIRYFNLGYWLTLEKFRTENLVDQIPVGSASREIESMWSLVFLPIFIVRNQLETGRMTRNRTLDPLESVDIDRFLAQETEDWCGARLQEMGVFEAPARDPDEPYRNFYLGLRRQI
ncbi:hypothetical protein E4U61_002541 [Claviceps capensis]|nr:hypothetical protein E4U61_002541 [Claviceps capensis]